MSKFLLLLISTTALISLGCKSESVGTVDVKDLGSLNATDNTDNDNEGERFPEETLTSCGDLEFGDVEERTAYAVGSVPYGVTCPAETQTRLCLQDGTFSEWSGVNEFMTCVNEEPLACGDIAHGETMEITRYLSAEVGHDEMCESEIQIHQCENGELLRTNGTFNQESCIQIEHLASYEYERDAEFNGYANTLVFPIGEFIGPIVGSGAPEGEMLSNFTAEGLPEGLVLGPNTGALSGTYNGVTNFYPVNFRARNQAGLYYSWRKTIYFGNPLTTTNAIYDISTPNYVSSRHEGFCLFNTPSQIICAQYAFLGVLPPRVINAPVAIADARSNYRGIDFYVKGVDDRFYQCMDDDQIFDMCELKPELDGMEFVNQGYSESCIRFTNGTESYRDCYYRDGGPEATTFTATDLDPAPELPTEIAGIDNPIEILSQRCAVDEDGVVKCIGDTQLRIMFDPRDFVSEPIP